MTKNAMDKADIEHMIFFWLTEHDFKIAFDQYAEKPKTTSSFSFGSFPNKLLRIRKTR
jgi:hypothetical protein